jgi:hypothetical protein
MTEPWNPRRHSIDIVDDQRDPRREPEPGRRAQLRDEILRRAEELDEDHARKIRSELAELGPVGLWQATVRGWLAEHGRARTDTYRFAAIMVGALEVGTDERQVRKAREEVVSFLLERFEV